MSLQMVGLAVVPTVILALIILFYDRFDREPFRLVLKVFLFGMLATLPTIAAETIGGFLNIFNGSLFGTFIEAFIVVGLAEEFFKRRVVMKHAFNHPAFDEKMDGIVYCSFAALGFATLENILYVTLYYANVPNVWLTRAILSVPAHVLLGVTMGYFLSLAKFCTDPVLKQKYMRRSLFIPVILHGIFDFILMSELPWLTFAIIPFVIYLWISSFKKLRIYYKDSKAINT